MWPGSRAPRAGHLLPAAGRELLTCFQVFWGDLCQTDQITLLANLTFPFQTIDKQDLAVIKIYHNDIILQSTSTLLSKSHNSMGDHSDR